MKSMVNTKMVVIMLFFWIFKLLKIEVINNEGFLNIFEKHLFKSKELGGVAQWVECAKQRVVSSIPSQGTCLGCRPGP